MQGKEPQIIMDFEIRFFYGEDEGMTKKDWLVDEETVLALTTIGAMCIGATIMPLFFWWNSHEVDLSGLAIFSVATSLSIFFGACLYAWKKRRINRGS